MLRRPEAPVKVSPQYAGVLTVRDLPIVARLGQTVYFTHGPSHAPFGRFAP